MGQEALVLMEGEQTKRGEWVAVWLGTSDCRASSLPPPVSLSLNLSLHPPIPLFSVCVCVSLSPPTPPSPFRLPLSLTLSLSDPFAPLVDLY